MLTGQPPVPEGTPAKKLHHHQHVAPRMHRELSPDIPDDVVLILGKMLAKNPKDRYARPILLVQHLMQVAQKVGAADDLPEGVLFVDAPLPGPPHSRPFLMILSVLAALVVVILLLSLAPEQRSQPPATPTKNGEVADSGNGAEKSTANVPSPAHAVTSVVVQKVEELKEALADASIKEIKIDKKKIDLNSTQLIYHGTKGHQLVIESKDADPDGHAIINFLYNDGATAGMVVEGDAPKSCSAASSSRSRSIPTSNSARPWPWCWCGIKKVTFDHCIFMQADVPALLEKRVPLASLSIDDVKGEGRPAPVVLLRECCFTGNSKTGGQAAIALNGPVDLHAANCAFKPHGAFFHFRQDSKGPRPPSI